MHPPTQFVIPDTGIMTATLGRAEREAAAALIIRLHHWKKATEWTPFRLPDMAELVRKDEVAAQWGLGYSVVRCWPDFRWLIDNGYLERREGEKSDDPDVVLEELMVTAKFVEAMERWRRES